MKLSWTNCLQNWSRIFRRKPQRRRNSHALLNGEHLEPRQLMTIYAIDPVNGSDSNPGSLELPFRTPKNLSFSTSEGNPDYRTLQAGDVVYLRDGFHDWSSLLTIPQTYDEHTAFMIRGVQGTEEAPVIIQAFPGERPIVTARESGVANMAIFVLQSEHIKVLGLEVTGTFGPGIRVGESSEIEIAHNYVHDIDGHHDNNVAGIYTSDTLGLHIHHNLLHDNYDRVRANTPGEIQRANSRNIVIFGDNSDRVVVHHNKVFNTPRADGRETGEGIWVKHASQIPGASFELYDNIVRDVQFSGIGSHITGAYMHHNLIVNSAPYLTTPDDDRVLATGHRIEFNTFVGSSAFQVFGNGPLPASDFLSFQNNIVVDQEPVYGVDHGIIRLHPYGSDAEYLHLVTPQNLTFEENIYFNPNAAPRWNVFSSEPPGTESEFGGNWTFSEWQAMGFDHSSELADPQFQASFVPTNPVAVNSGWWASEQPRLAMYVAHDMFRESAGAAASSVTLVRSGMDLSQPLVVTLTTSDSTEIQLPQTVTFAAGVSVVEVPLTAVDDNQNEPTRAVQIFATTESDLQSSEWVRVLQDSGNPPPPPDVNQPGIVEFVATSQTVNENNGKVTLTLTRHGGSSGAIDVNYTTRGGTAASNSDFTAKSGQVRFADGENSKTITIALRNDTRTEANEAFTVSLTRISGRATLGSTKTTTVIIRDDEPRAPRVSNVRLLTNSTSVVGLIVQFDSPMDQASVTKRSGYVLREAGRDGRLGTTDDRSLSIKSISFNAVTNKATLTFSRAVSLGSPVRLKILSSTILGVTRLALDGDANDVPGGNYERDLSLGR